MGLIGKMKEKLHIGDEKSTGSASNQSDTTPTNVVNPASPRSTGTGTGTQKVSSHSASPQHGSATSAAHASSGAPGTGTGVGKGSGISSGSESGVGSGAGTKSQTSTTTHSEAVTIHERDPNWQKARDLTTGAEYQSKLSAAKAYEAEAFLVGATESHEAAQAALNAKANLVAQAEAEKRNMGAADYVRTEHDHVKKVQEDMEKHRIEVNKNLDKTQGLVTAKEKELQAALPVAQQQAAQIKGLSNELGALKETRSGLENKEAENAQRLRDLEGQKGQFAGQAGDLEGTVAKLTKHADDLERQAKAARDEANRAAARLKEVKGNLASISRDHNDAAKSHKGLQRDLESYRKGEAELADKLRAAQIASAAAADAAAAKEAELQLAKQKFEAEKAKGQPLEQEIEKYRKQIHEKESQLTEAVEASKTAKAAYEKFMAQANEADAAHKQALSEKERKLSTYTEHKQEAELANARASDMWTQAKKYGNTGDANALQRLAEAEKTLREEEGTVSRKLVPPVVGPKQPTSEGPKFTRTEDSREMNEDTQKESVRTKTGSDVTSAKSPTKKSAAKPALA